MSITKLKWLKKIMKKPHSFQNGVPFGLCNASPTFQKIVTKTFKPYLNKFIACIFG
jgi:hypothetical protein